MSDTIVHVRIPESLCKRISELVSPIQDLPEYGGVVTVSRSMILRLAISLGVERMERDCLDISTPKTTAIKSGKRHDFGAPIKGTCSVCDCYSTELMRIAGKMVCRRCACNDDDLKGKESPMPTSALGFV